MPILSTYRTCPKRGSGCGGLHGLWDAERHRGGKHRGRPGGHRIHPTPGARRGDVVRQGDHDEVGNDD